MTASSKRLMTAVWVIALAWCVASTAEAAQEQQPAPTQSGLESETVEERLKRIEDELKRLRAEKEQQRREEERIRSELERQKNDLKSLTHAVREIPRTIHEHGPPGYVRRRYLDESPANPTFIPTTVPQPETVPTAGEKKKFVTAGSFPHSILIPGTDTSIGVRGFIRLNVLYSMDPIGDDRQFNASTIPVPQQSGTSTNFDFSWSRLTLESHTKNKTVDDVKTFLQTDFFGANSTLRVRWAYVDFSYFRAGQAASVFMDYDIWPNVIDPDGPNAMLLKRHPLVQVTIPFNQQSKLALGFEDPDGSITLPTNGTGSAIGKAINKIPDFTGNLRYDHGSGHVQVSGLVRKLTYEVSPGANVSAIGYGAHFSADIHPWAAWTGHVAANPDPTALQKSRLMGQVAFGRGFSSYLESIASGMDGAVDASGSLEALPITTWTLGYEHWWARNWTSTLSFGQYNISGNSGLPGTSETSVKNFMGNLIWLPLTNMWLGMEFQWAKRRIFTGQDAEAKRILWGIHYAY